MNHLIDILQLSTQEIDELVEKATDIIANPEAYAHKCAAAHGELPSSYTTSFHSWAVTGSSSRISVTAA